MFSWKFSSSSSSSIALISLLLRSTHLLCRTRTVHPVLVWENRGTVFCVIVSLSPGILSSQSFMEIALFLNTKRSSVEWMRRLLPDTAVFFNPFVKAMKAREEWCWRGSSSAPPHLQLLLGHGSCLCLISSFFNKQPWLCSLFSLRKHFLRWIFRQRRPHITNVNLRQKDFKRHKENKEMDQTLRTKRRRRNLCNKKCDEDQICMIYCYQG